MMDAFLKVFITIMLNVLNAIIVICEILLILGVSQYYYKKQNIKRRMLEFFNNENNNISKTLEKNLCICCYFLPLIDIINGFSEELFSTAGWITTYNTYVFPFLFIYNKYYQCSNY